jgi:hypothetical protein
MVQIGVNLLMKFNVRRAAMERNEHIKGAGEDPPKRSPPACDGLTLGALEDSERDNPSPSWPVLS